MQMHFLICLVFLRLFVSKFVGFGGSIDLAAILDFVDSGHDLIIAADNNASDLIREIATECGVDFDEVCISEPNIFFAQHFNSIQYFCVSRWLADLFIH